MLAVKALEISVFCHVEVAEVFRMLPGVDKNGRYKFM
jgi:hypothetical protein